MDRDFVNKMAAAFEDELVKIAHRKLASAAEAVKAVAKKPSMLVPGIAVGALGTIGLQRAHRDWRMGRAMRLQNSAQGY